MELVSLSHYSISSCHPISNLHLRNPFDGSPNSKQFKPFLHQKDGILCSGSRHNWQIGLPSQALHHKEGHRLLDLLEGLQKLAFSDSASVSSSYYATSSDVSLRSTPKRVEEVTKVMIPRLPNESGGDPESPISSCYWEWKPKLTVHYEKSGEENVGAPAVLFLPGFGVGSFHYENQLKDLGRDYRVFALDFLGQGKSLPLEDPAPANKQSQGSEDEKFWGFGEASEPWANELVYSVDLWKDQVQNFIEKVIGEPVYIVGNSLGGFVAVYFAACDPQLVKGVALLNATPFWGFLPNPARSPRLSKLFPWAGTFPLPPSIRKLTEFVWQKISDPRSIRDILKQVYADHSTKVDKVFCHIVETTQHPAAAASFASIMCAPTGQMSFQEALSRCKMEDIKVCLMYGREDPWVRPFWGLKVKDQLPEVPYYEISPAGHCPHDEVPEVVNFLLRGWIKNLESQGSVSLPLLDETHNNEYVIAKELEYLKEGGSRKSVKVQFLGSKFSVWNFLFLLVKPLLAKLQTIARRG